MKDRIERVASSIPELRGERTVTPLEGGLTNTNYKIDVGGQSYVLRLNDSNSSLLGIDREIEYECTRQAALLGICGEVIAFRPGESALVTRYIPGRVLSEDDIREPEMLERVLETLRIYHEQPSCMGYFSAFDTVRNYYALAKEHNVSFPLELADALDRFYQVEKLMERETPHWCPCHNDLLAANFIDDGQSIHVIDWEYAGMGELFLDLANLASNCHFEDEDEELLLTLYFGEVKQKHLVKLHLMRLASDMREAMWGFFQVGISKLDIDYMSYGSDYLERFISGYERWETAVAKR